MEEGVEEQGEVGIGGCVHDGGVVEGVQGDHFSSQILSHLGGFILRYEVFLLHCVQFFLV